VAVREQENKAKVKREKEKDKRRTPLQNAAGQALKI
jgi:hypothetical protein